jgi:hypothetical protein
VNEKNQPTTPVANEGVSGPVPSIWTLVWLLLTSISGFTAAYFAFNGSNKAIWAGLAAGVFMLLAQVSKSKTDAE